MLVNCGVHTTLWWCTSSAKVELFELKTKREFMLVIQSESGFFRIHKSYLLNMEHVKGYKRGKGGYAELSNGEELEIAVRRKGDFLQQFAG